MKYNQMPFQRTVGAIFLVAFLSACSDSDSNAKNVATNSVSDSSDVSTDAGAAVTPIVYSTDYTTTPSTVVSGDITVLTDGVPAGDVVVKVRGEDIEAVLQENGTYDLALERSDVERSVILDIVGENVVEKSVSVQIPANAENSILDTTIATRTPPISFNLDEGGVLGNTDSGTRTSVTVPANAFQFLDGTAASGMAEVNITELDILDLEADSSWAPNFIGIPEGSNEATAITTYGMSEFHFSQNGRELDLRPGVSATLSMDLALPYISAASGFIAPTPGATQPLWWYDISDLVWKEEGSVTISADADSATGFVAKGDVSHFSYWNIDYVTPFLDVDVNIRVIDQFGNPRNDVQVSTYDTFVGIPADEGAEYNGQQEGLSTWNNSKLLTPTNKFIQIIGNTTTNSDGTLRPGRVDMNIIVNKVTSSTHGVISSTPMQQRRYFEVGGDSSVYFDVVVPIDVEPPAPPESTLMATEVIVDLIDLQGNPVVTLEVDNYTVIANASNGWTSNNRKLSPASRKLTVQGNTPEALTYYDEPVSTEVTLVDLYVKNVGKIDLINAYTESRVFKTSEGTTSIVFSVPVVDF